MNDISQDLLSELGAKVCKEGINKVHDDVVNSKEYKKTDKYKTSRCS